MSIAPQTIENEIVNGLNLLQESGRFVSKDSLQWRKLERATRDLIKADAAKGWTVMGMVHASVGDINEAVDCFNKASNLWMDDTSIFNILGTYEKLGLYTTALKLYSEFGGPERGVFQEVFAFGMSKSAFQLTSRFIDAAKRVKIEMNESSIRSAEKSAKILRGFNISDEDVAKHLDAAGVVLRDKKMLNIREPEILATDIEGEMIGVTMIIPIECDPSEVFSYNVALAKKEEEAGVRKHPAFDVVFAAL